MEPHPSQPNPRRLIAARNRRAQRFPLGAAVTLAELENDPHPPLAALREREPVSWIPVLDGWLVTRRDLALEVMRADSLFTVDDARFSTGRMVGPSMLTRDGVEHARHRAPFARPFRRTAVLERFTGPVTREADTLIDGFPECRKVELRRGYAGPLAAAVVMRALGLEQAGLGLILRSYDAIVAGVTAITAGREEPPAARQAFGELREGIEAVLDGGEASLLRSAAQAGLSRNEVLSNAAVLLFGGIETTEGMIANAVLHLLSDPAQLAEVRADPALVAGAVEESLRLEPAAAVVDRYATADTVLATARIGRGELVSVSVTAANRDPGAFADPDRFDVRRPNSRLHLAFAHGPHVCVGMHLARLEAQVGVGRLLERLGGLRLDPARPPVVAGLVFRKPRDLWVRWEDPAGRCAV